MLIAWSSADEELNGNADLSDRLNQFNIEGVFYKDGKLGDVMQITKNTDEDHFADTDPQAVYYETADDKGRIKLYYTKSEFTVSKPEEGEVVGDLLNPDQLNLVREYDVASGEWVSTYDAETEAGIRAKLKGQNPGASDDELEELYEKYVTDWYGQVFLDLAPAVDITETLDENGNWSLIPSLRSIPRRRARVWSKTPTPSPTTGWGSSPIAWTRAAWRKRPATRTCICRFSTPRPTSTTIRS